jgi:hypothetical protein
MAPTKHSSRIPGLVIPLLLSLVLVSCGDEPLSVEVRDRGEVEVTGLPNDTEWDINWGDGSTDNNGLFPAKHYYAYNGEYRIKATDHRGSWPFERTASVQVGVTTAKDKQRWNVVGGMSALAALIAAVVGLLSFLVGRRQGRNDKRG